MQNNANPYFDSQIMYYKESIAQIKVFRNSKNRGFTTKKVSLSQLVIDGQGNPMRSCAKQRRGFVANYVHFLDAYICHYVIDQCTKENIRISTVHDSFFVEPRHIEFVNTQYRQGLLNCSRIHFKNIISWLLIIISEYYHEVEGLSGLSAAQKGELQSMIRKLSLWAGAIETGLISHECCVDFINNVGIVISALRLVQKRLVYRQNIENIIVLIKMLEQKSMEDFLAKYGELNRFSLFS